MHNGILYLAGQSLKELMLPIIGSELIVNLIMTLICIGILFMLVAVSALVFTLGERKVCAWIQVRIAAVYSGYAEAFDQGGYYSSWGR